MAALYLRISNLFDANARTTTFRLETRYIKVEENYEEAMLRMDYDFMENLKAAFDEKIKIKFPTRRSLIACNQSIVR